MNVFKAIANTLITIGYFVTEDYARNTIENSEYFGLSGADYSVKYQKEHGEFPNETKLREFDEHKNERKEKIEVLLFK